MFAPKPSAVREYALATFRPSLWYYANGFLVGGILIAAGGRLLYLKFQPIQVGFAVLCVGVLTWLVTMLRARTIVTMKNSTPMPISAKPACTGSNFT